MLETASPPEIPLDKPSSADENTPTEENRTLHRLMQIWDGLVSVGLGESAIRIATHLLLVMLVLGMVWVLRGLYLNTSGKGERPQALTAFSVPQATPTPTMSPPVMPVYDPQALAEPAGVPRLADPHTIIPSRPRVDVITYTVQAGDTVIGIAGRFGLKPETILWSNYNVLADDPHRLQVGQVLDILPVDGTYHKWRAGEDLRKVAEFYGVDPMAIIEWPGNHFDIYATDIDNPGIAPGTMLIVPGGHREMIDYGPPRIPRDKPAVARTYGPGYCGEIMDGAIGDGNFIWPIAVHTVIGYDYSPAINHLGIDIGGDLGDPVWAVDHGVVVFAGWSTGGYGNLVVVDHGNGWQSLYGHLDQVYVGCGSSVYQGTVLGTLGTTGNSSGPHLHFELIYGTAKVNPHNFLP